MKMLIGGKWRENGKVIEVRNPYNNSLLDTVPDGSEKEVNEAIESALRGFEIMRNTSAYERSNILSRVSKKIAVKAEDLARLLAAEVGKTIKEARGELDRCVQTFALASEEARQLHGETIPVNAAPGIKNDQAFYVRVPLGVIGAITPFNFPLNLTAHKLAPALAAGNSVVLKPPSTAPLTVLKLAEILLEAGLPPESLNVITGSGRTVGRAIVRDERLKMITFTGSLAAGKEILKEAGLKKVALELGSNSAVILMPDADLDVAVPRIISGAYAVAGQVCISVQRVLVHEDIRDGFLDRFVPLVKKLKLGNQLDETTDVGPMISEDAARRTLDWVSEAVSQGAKVLTGGKGNNTLFEPTVLTDVSTRMKVFCEEAFAPLVTVNTFHDLSEAIRLANNSQYGLQAGIYTKNIADAFRAAKELEVGGVMINEVPCFRVDQMPYGGVKGSGMGKEGPKYVMQEMTEMKLIYFRL